MSSAILRNGSCLYDASEFSDIYPSLHERLSTEQEEEDEFLNFELNNVEEEEGNDEDCDEDNETDKDASIIKKKGNLVKRTDSTLLSSFRQLIKSRKSTSSSNGSPSPFSSPLNKTRKHFSAESPTTITGKKSDDGSSTN
jgi:hypothetical protein